MSSNKMCSVFVNVLLLCVVGFVAAGPVELVPIHTAAKQKGDAVLFFVAYQGQLRDIEFNPIIFNQVLVNQGSGYDNGTGVFTAPLAGIYQFVFAAQLCRGNHNNLWSFMVKETQKMLCHAQVSGGDTTLNTCYFMTELKKGDRVSMKQVEGSCAWANTVSTTITFSGVLLASDGASMLGGKYDSASSCPLLNFGHKKNLMLNSACRGAVLSGVAISLLLSLTLLFE